MAVSTRNHVAERLQALLTERQVAPGDRLPPERQLAAELGISRASLREGLRRLIDLGVLEARQGSGTYLAEIDLADLLAVRLRIEPYAAGLAAQRRTDADLKRLDELCAELRDTLPDAEAFADADLRLHAAVVEATGSPALRVLQAALSDLLRHSRAHTSPDASLRAAALERIEQLTAAIRAGDARAAERTMRAHLRDVGGVIAPATSAVD